MEISLYFISVFHQNVKTAIQPFPFSLRSLCYIILSELEIEGEMIVYRSDLKSYTICANVQIREMCIRMSPSLLGQGEHHQCLSYKSHQPTHPTLSLVP